MARRTRVFWIMLLGGASALMPGKVAAQGAPSSRNTSQESRAAQNFRLVDAYGRLPLSFEANEGQTDAQVKFLSRGAGQTLFLTSTEAVLVLSTHHGKNEALSSRFRPEAPHDDLVRMKLVGARRDAQVSGLERLPGTSNYFLGNDPAMWRKNISMYEKVRYSQIYRGVDLVYYGNQRELEYDFIVAPGVDPGIIRLSIIGPKRIWIDRDGNAVLQCGQEIVRLQKPRLYQEGGALNREISGRYLLKGHVLRFSVAKYDHRQPLVIDPVLTYSTYLGGNGSDGGAAIAVDALGNAYITGSTSSTDFPGIGSGSFQSSNGGRSVPYVAKLNPSGSAIVYATYLGGTGTDNPRAIAADSAGNAYVAGGTNSTDFPVNNAKQLSNAGGYDFFVTKLNSTGSALLYSTYLGSTGDEEAYGIAVDSQGNAYLAGYSTSIVFPGSSSNPIQPFKSGALSNAVVAKLNAAGSAINYATYLGGSGDTASGIAVDSSGNAYVIGNTASSTFPVTANAAQSTFGGGSGDAFVSKINSGGTALSYSTYLGGSGYDVGKCIAADNSGNAYVTGYTKSPNFPGVTANSIQPASDGNYDTFVGKLNTVTGAITYATYLGTSFGSAIAVDSMGNAYVTGNTSSTTFPGVNSASPQPTIGGGTDAFVAGLNPVGSALTFSTYLGGSGYDSANSIAVDSLGNVYVVGDTSSGNFPVTSSSAEPSLPANFHGFVAMYSFAAGVRAPSQVMMTSSANPSAQSQTVTLTATVSGSGGTPAGTVSFLDSGTTIGSAILSGGQASFSLSSLSIGTHSITAVYNGDTAFTGSTSSPLTQTVLAFGSSVSLSSSSLTTTFGQSVTFTATVTGSGAGQPTGNIAFLDGVSTLLTASLASGTTTATFTTSSLTVGTHSITAAYSGDTNFAPNTSMPLLQTVNWPATFDGGASSGGGGGGPSTASITLGSVIAVGSGPVALALNPVNDKLYVANQSSNTITVIDASTNSVVNTVGVGKAPSAVAINSLTNTIYVADRDSGDVAVIDGTTDTLTAQIPVPQTASPISLAVNPTTNEIYVGTDALAFAVIDGATQKVTTVDPFLLGGPASIAVSPLSNRVYVGDWHDATVEVYEGSTNFLLTAFTDNQAVALAVNPATGKLYVADNGSLAYFQIFDEASETVTTSAPIASAYALAFNATTNSVYVAGESPASNQPGTVTVFDGNTGATTASFPVGATQLPDIIPLPNKMAVDEAANLVYVANDASNNVSVVDGALSLVFTNLALGASPVALVRDPFSCDVYVASSGAGTVSVLTPTLSGPGVCLSASVLGFGSQALNTTSSPQAVTLTNDGSAALTITSISTTGDFSETDTCPPVAPATTRSIGPGQKCTIQVTFTPTAVGIRTGQITISDNAFSGTQVIQLGGDGGIPANVQLAVNPNPVEYGQFPTLTAKVTGTFTANPTGSVTFLLDGQTTLGVQPLGATGTATLSSTTMAFLLPAGSQHSITARYNGDLNYASTPSAPTALVITQGQSAIVAIYYAPATAQLTAYVDAIAPANGTPTGTVLFLEGQTVLATASLTSNGSAVAPVSLSGGSHSISATYQGDQNFLGSSYQPPLVVLVPTPTVTTLTASPFTTVYSNPVTFTVTVTANPPGGAQMTGNIVLLDGQTTIATAPIAGTTSSGTTTSPGITGLTIGQHSIKAQFQDTSGAFQGSISAAVVVTVNAPSTGGSAPGCACSLTGNYQTPPAPVALATTSPHSKYTVTPGSGFITVTDVSGNNPPATINFANSTTNWGFSPDDDRLVLQYLTSVNGATGTAVDNIQVYDLSVTPPRIVVGAHGAVASPVGAISSVSFSPSGRYLLLNFVSAQSGATLPVGELQIYLVQGVASDLPIYQTTFTFSNSANTNTGVVEQGFSPVSPETSFVFAYLDSNGLTQWQLVSLAQQQTLLASASLNDTADFWEYSPCGDIIGLVRQTTPLGQPISVEVDLKSTVTGAALQGSGYTVNSPNVTLLCSASGQQIQVGGGQTTTISPNTTCSNTPLGNNITVVPQDTGGSGQAPVTVTFTNVSTSGATSVLVSAPAPQDMVPVNFQLGTPPSYFDLTTTATFSSAKVCVSYSNITFANSTPALLHYDGGMVVNSKWVNGQWVDHTIRPVDTVHQIICADVSSFSPFVVVEQVSIATSASISASNVTYGTPATVSVSVSSATDTVTGNVTLSVDGGSTSAAALSNGSATFNLGVLSAGAHTLSASFAAQGSFLASAAAGTLTVTPAPLTISANNAASQYGTPNPALSATGTGFVNNDTAAALSGTLSCTSGTTPSSPVGTYSINCSGVTSSNYAITYVPAMLTINPAPLTIMVNNPSRPYGANNPAVIPTITGLLNGDIITATDATSATLASPVGNYVIVPTAIGAATVLNNYAISLVNGTLSITPETTSLTVTLSPLSIPVGNSATATVTLTAPDMVIPIDPSALAAITLTSPVVSDILSNNGVCTPVPSTTPGLASCTITLTSVEPNGRTLNASFAGSADLVTSTATGDLMVTAALQSQQVCIKSDFRNVAVPGGSYLWFNSIFKVRDVTKQLIHISFFQSTAQFQYTEASGNAVTVNQTMPDAHITIDPSATTASTAFDSVNNVWMTTIPWDLDDNSFLTGMPWLVPSAGLPADVEPVTVCGTFASDVAGIDIGWRWSAAAYSSFSSDSTTLGVKPMDTDFDNPGTNHDLAGTPENYKQFVIPGARGKGGKNYTGTYSGSKEIE
jgi:YVTN family beta-propeller protein